MLFAQVRPRSVEEGTQRLLPTTLCTFSAAGMEGATSQISTHCAWAPMIACFLHYLPALVGMRMEGQPEAHLEREGLSRMIT